MTKKQIAFGVLMALLLTANIVTLTFLCLHDARLAKVLQTYNNAVLDLPVFSINTANNAPINSKEEYVDCLVTVNNAGEYNFENKEAQIRGRGNSTWGYPKKPYKLKFSSKTKLFGNAKAKTWTLIANYIDDSMMRNYLAYNVAQEFDDLNYTTSTKYVDVYINGEYNGVYLVCEQVEVNDNRVAISEDYTDVNTGYLIEMDAWASSEGVEGIDYFVCEGKNFTIKSPEVEPDKMGEYIAYIKEYLTQCFQALDSNDYDLVTQYIDVNSFADSYLLNELFKNRDVDYSSFYMYKDKDAKLCSGPVWDYDQSAGNSSNVAIANDSNSLYVKDGIFYSKLLKYTEFKQIVSTKLAKYHDEIVETIISEIDYVLTHYKNSFERNFLTWDTLGHWVPLKSPELTQIDTWVGQVEFLREWLLSSLDYLSTVYNDT